MKNTLSYTIAALIILGLGFNSCKKKEDPPPPPPPPKKTVESIAITTQPTNKTYTVGDTFDATGMVVTATYTDKSTAPVTITAAMIAFDSNTPGTDKTAIITYETKTATVTGITINAAFVAVTDVNEVPDAATVETPLTLTGTVTPATATNKTITWSLVSTTLADIATVSDGELNATAAGTAKVRATIVNGATATTNYTKEFTITITFSPGSAGDPFIVNDLATLNKVGSGTDDWDLDKYYKQTASIDFTGEWTPIGTSTGDSFTGTYDGGGFTIKDLKNDSGTSDLGLFGYIGEGGVVKNLALKFVVLNTTSGSSGGIAGTNRGTIENCYVTGGVVGTNSVGGIAGSNIGIIRNCYTICVVAGLSANDFFGGIAGRNYGMIETCFATVSTTGRNQVGGIAAYNVTMYALTATIQNCVALNALVSSTSGTSTTIGRVVGQFVSGTLYNNAARDAGMKILRNGVTYTPTAATTTADGKDGLSTGASYTHGPAALAFWSSAGDTNLWDIVNNRLPHLKTTEGNPFADEQFPVVVTLP